MSINWEKIAIPYSEATVYKVYRTVLFGLFVYLRNLVCIWDCRRRKILAACQILTNFLYLWVLDERPASLNLRHHVLLLTVDVKADADKY